MLETYLMRRSAARMTKEDYAELRGMCAKMTTTRSHDKWLALNTDFHDRLYSHASAPVASELSHQLSLRVQRYVSMVRSSELKRAGDPNQEHLAILDALERNDLATAQAQLADPYPAHRRSGQAHLRRVEERRRRGRGAR